MKNIAQSVPSVSSFLGDILHTLKWKVSINHTLYLGENQEDLPNQIDIAACMSPAVYDNESLNYISSVPFIKFRRNCTNADSRANVISIK